MTNLVDSSGNVYLCGLTLEENFHAMTAREGFIDKAVKALRPNASSVTLERHWSMYILSKRWHRRCVAHYSHGAYQHPSYTKAHQLSSANERIDVIARARWVGLSWGRFIIDLIFHVCHVTQCDLCCDIHITRNVKRDLTQLPSCHATMWHVKPYTLSL